MPKGCPEHFKEVKQRKERAEENHVGAKNRIFVAWKRSRRMNASQLEPVQELRSVLAGGACVGGGTPLSWNPS